MSRGVLLIGGAGPGRDFISRVIESGDLICCADSGLDAAITAGIEPDRIVGDMDSISDTAVLKRFPADIIDIHPGDKDETDTEIGLAWLRDKGCDNLVIIGGGEGRLDHTLALLSLFGTADPPNLWFTARERIESISGEIEINGEPSSPVSFSTTGPGPWDAVSQGLYWELDGVQWKSGTVSLSNRLNGTAARIKVKKGRLLMIRELFQIDLRK